MCEETVTLKRIGWDFSGQAHIKLGLGGETHVAMKPWTIMTDRHFYDIPKAEWQRGINDGCRDSRGIVSCYISISALYENGYRQHFGSYDIDNIE
jgi:hypothetical protein